jgi:acetyl esterase/lipase
MACYRGLGKKGVRRIGVTGESAGGNLALVLASLASGESAAAKTTPAGVVAFSPVTDLTLSGESYTTRADVEPYFTREQVAELVHAYLGAADPKHPMASPLYASLSGLPPVRIHVGDDEVLLDDSRRFVEQAVAAGADARLDIWLGMDHGFTGNIGTLKAATLAFEAAGSFLAERLKAPQ